MSNRSNFLVLFGATGDLALRMLLPSLLNLEAEGRLEEGFRCLGVARTDLTADGYRQMVEAHLRRTRAQDFDPAAWARLAARLDYVSADATTDQGVAELAARLQGVDSPSYYLAVSPSLYGAISAGLARAGLAGGGAQVVLEKPIGRDLATSRAINDAVAAVFSEARTFRIDHYLGKETVQNLLALRFANVLFEPLWSNRSIDHIQITIAETEGVGDRWPYYDDYGALRDMVQNHLLQLLALVAMEPPARMSADAVRDEKVKVLRSLRPLAPAGVNDAVARGQYAGGVVGGEKASAYEGERGGPSGTETYVAVEAYVDNWRWAGVPFFLRTGKRLAERQTQVVVQFRAVPHSIFGGSAGADLQPNRLTIDLQPREDVQLLMMNRAPGLHSMGDELRPLPLSLSLAAAFNSRRRIAYERLLLDALAGNQTLFVSRTEVEAAWAWIDGVAEAVREDGRSPELYPAGSWGPPSGESLIRRSGRCWHG